MLAGGFYSAHFIAGSVSNLGNGATAHKSKLATNQEVNNSLDNQHLTKQKMKNQIVGLEARQWMLVNELKDVCAAAYIHIEVLSGLVDLKDLKTAVASCMEIINPLQDILESLTGKDQWTLWLTAEDAERCGFAGLTFGNGTFEVLSEKDRPQEGR